MSLLGWLILQLSTFFNFDWPRRFTTLGSNAFNFLDNVHAFDHTSENNMLNIVDKDQLSLPELQSYLSIKPLSLDCAKEKLRTICARSSIGHWENTRSCVLELEVLVSKFHSVNWFTTSTVVISEISSLNVSVITLRNMIRIKLPGTWIGGWHGGMMSWQTQIPFRQCKGHGSFPQFLARRQSEVPSRFDRLVDRQWTCQSSIVAKTFWLLNNNYVTLKSLNGHKIR